MTPSRPPGWYTDSVDPTRERWWDGGEWSHVTRPGPERPAPRTRAVPPMTAPSLPGSYDPAAASYAQWRPGVAFGPTTPDGVPLAELPARLGARILDYVVTTLLSALLGSPAWLPVVRDANTRFDEALRAGTSQDVVAVYRDLVTDERLVPLVLVSLAVSAAYTIILLTTRGATLGKLAVGIRVRSWDSEGLPTWRQATLRWVTREGLQVLTILGTLYWVLDSAWPLWDARRQALHDKLPGTVVVRR